MIDEEGDWRLRTFDRSFRLIRCGIIVGIEGGHAKGSLGLVYVSRGEGKADFIMVSKLGSQPEQGGGANHSPQTMLEIRLTACASQWILRAVIS